MVRTTNKPVAANVCFGSLADIAERIRGCLLHPQKGDMFSVKARRYGEARSGRAAARVRKSEFMHAYRDEDVSQRIKLR